MRLLQISVRNSLLYSLIVVLISIPVSIFAIRELLKHEVDEALTLHADQFLHHIQRYSYLDDLESDLGVFDELSYDIDIKPYQGKPLHKKFQSTFRYDSSSHELTSFRELSSDIDIKCKHYIVTVRMPMVDNHELITAVGIVQSALIILLAAGLLLLNRSLSRKLWQPFYKTLNQLKAYQLDTSETIYTDRTTIIEFDDLNKTINHLIESNRKVYINQKEFIENASHELQTPIAIFQSKLDILMQSSSLNEAAAETIVELEETAQRMSRLNRNLLLLSKIDNNQFNQLEDIELSEIATALLINLKPLANLNEITIETNIAGLTLSANKTLIEVLLTNLFHNAIRHTKSKGNVRVELKDCTITIVNTGNPLTMNADKMFERFSKENTNEKSTGLGLAIVKKIVDTCNYKMQYYFHEGEHTFSVTFFKIE